MKRRKVEPITLKVLSMREEETRRKWMGKKVSISYLTTISVTGKITDMRISYICVTDKGRTRIISMKAVREMVEVSKR